MNDTDVVPTGESSPPGEASPGQRDSDLWQRHEPRSLISLLPSVVGESLIAASDQRPDLFGLDERTLHDRLRSEKRPPTPTDNRLRLSFWNEYDRVQAEGLPKMEVARFVSGLCPKSYFYAEYLKRPEKVAWLVTRPADYEVFMREALNFGLEQLREILDLPLWEEDPRTGDLKLNLKVAELKAKIVTMIDQRVKGAVLQRIEQKNLNLSVTEKQVGSLAMENTVEELRKRLVDLNKRDRLAAPTEPPKEET